MLDRSKSPDIKPFGHMKLPECRTEVLDNGLTLHTLSGGDQDIARLSLILEGGSDDCPNPCMAEFAAEMLREGSALHTGEQLADILDYNGAWLTASASGHHTAVRLSALTSKLAGLLPDFVACLTSPTFGHLPLDVIRRKGVARQRLNLSRVGFLASADNRRLICGPEHPESVIVAPDDMEKMTVDSVRDFHYSRVDAGRIHAFLAGKLSDSLIGDVRHALAAIEHRDVESPIKIVPYAPMSPQTSTIGRPESLQSAVVMSIPSIGRHHPDYNGLRMAVTALGGYFGSRLMTNIRENKGYTYGISAALFGSLDGSFVSISAQCDNRYTDALVAEVRNELDEMVSHPLSDAELERLRFNVASDLASTLDSPLAVMDYHELQLTIGIPDGYFDARQRLLSTIDAASICRLSQKYLNPAELRISIVGKQV